MAFSSSQGAVLFWLISNSKQFIQIQSEMRHTLNPSYSSETRMVPQFNHLGGEGRVCLLSQGVPWTPSSQFVQHRDVLRWMIHVPHQHQTPQQRVTPFTDRAAAVLEQVVMRALLFPAGKTWGGSAAYGRDFVSYNKRKPRFLLRQKEMQWQGAGA